MILVRQGNGPNGVDRESLRAPFHSQCYLAALLALGISGSEVLNRYSTTMSESGAMLLSLGTLLVYGLCQTFWFARQLAVSKLRGFWYATHGMIISVIAIMIISFYFS